MKCSSCGTVYTPPATGTPYCPNNNCPMHQGNAGPSSLRAAADTAMREAEVWAQAVKDAEVALAQTRERAQAAQADVILKLEAAKQAAQAEADAIAQAAAQFQADQ